MLLHKMIWCHKLSQHLRQLSLRAHSPPLSLPLTSHLSANISSMQGQLLPTHPAPICSLTTAETQSWPELCGVLWPTQRKCKHVWHLS